MRAKIHRKGLLGALFALMLAAGVTVAYAQTTDSSNREPVTPTADTLNDNRDCDFGTFTTTSSLYVPVPFTVVSVFVPGTTAKDVILHFSSETLKSTATNRIDIRYRIDVGAATVAGAEFGFRGATSGTGFEISNQSGVLHVLPGVHTIQPMIRVVGGGSGTLFFRCLNAVTAEIN